MPEDCFFPSGSAIMNGIPISREEAVVKLSKGLCLWVCAAAAVGIVSCQPKSTVPPVTPMSKPVDQTLPWLQKTQMVKPWFPTSTADYSFIRVVNTADDHDDGTCDAADCSLREAIDWANVVTWALIQFDIPGAGVHTIRPAYRLPDITAPVVVDGSSQPGYAGSPLIELEGSLVDVPDAADDGLTISATAGQSIIRGLAITRWRGAGINVLGEGVRILGDFLGIDPTGSFAKGNHDGIVVDAGNCWIGSPKPGDRNIISGNIDYGISYFHPASNKANTLVRGNYIGTDATGTAAVPNGVSGILIYAAMEAGMQIGGAEANEGNVISGNGVDGILVNISHPQNGGFSILGNFIGTAADGATALGNHGNGINLFGSRSVDIEHNVAAFNGENGVFIQAGKDAAETPVDSYGNTVRSNSIHDNIKLGIAVDEDGVIPNDPQDLDTGANGRQNFPEIASAQLVGSQLAVKGSFIGAVGGEYALEFYWNETCDPSGFGEGRQVIGTASLTANANGLGTINAALPGDPAWVGGYLTALATDGAGNTSEFSQCVLVTGLTKPALPPAAFFTPKVTPSQVFYRGAGCGGKEISFQVGVADPKQVAGVWLFVRLRNKGGDGVTNWADALVMIPQGNGWYFFQLSSEKIPGFTKYDDAWVQYQFVAYDADFQRVATSDVYSDVELTVCHTN
jgi:CSLREA domain-containing protein